MEIKNIISSGLIEMYCMGLASEEEASMIEKLAQQHKIIRDEIDSVHESLNQYALASSKNPSAGLKNKIINQILSSKNNNLLLQFPPRLSSTSSVSEWLKYISDNQLSAPENFGDVFLIDLPGNDTQVSYIAWAKKGSVVEESHENEDEYLLMVKGHCSITMNGKVNYYKEGDVIFIPGKTVHRAEALSDEIMILVGQRIAA